MKKDGFTLLEMAIGLIIIGLVIGGIIQGVSLMDSAKMKRVASDLSDINNAIALFNDKYGYFPGDMPNATTVWGRADGGADVTQNCANPDTNINLADPMATCNGNGNHRIADYSASAAMRNNEAYRFWQHLSNAGLISGKYTGIGGAPGSAPWRVAMPGENVMTSGISGSGFFVLEEQLQWFCNSSSAWSGTNAARDQNFLSVGGKTETSWPWRRIFTSEEVQSVDLKMDDGKPGTGNIIALCPTICATSQDTDTAEYIPSSEDARCGILMPLQQ